MDLALVHCSLGSMRTIGVWGWVPFRVFGSMYKVMIR